LEGFSVVDLAATGGSPESPPATKDPLP